MNEWKELNIDDLPSDIAKEIDGKLIYEFRHKGVIASWVIDNNRITYILESVRLGVEYQYRKRQPEKQQTHNEIVNQVKFEMREMINSHVSEMKKESTELLNKITEVLNRNEQEIK